MEIRNYRGDIHGTRRLVTSGNEFPCRDRPTLAFSVPAQHGKVYYLAHLNYNEENDQLKVEYKADLSAAAQFINAAYPALRDQLVQGSFEVVPTTKSCKESRFSIIFISG